MPSPTPPTSKCKQIPTLQGSLEYCPGTTVQPGLRDHLYYISARDIVGWPKRMTPTDSGATMAGLATLSGEFTLAADKKWKRIDLIPDKGKLECEVVGSFPSRLYENKTSVVCPGVDEQATGFCQLAAAEHFVFLVPQRDGRYRLLGSASYKVELKPKLDTGEGATGEVGTTIDISVKDISPAPFFPGKIEIDGGTLSGATDTPTS